MSEESKEKPRVPLPRYRPHCALIVQDENGRQVWRRPPLELVQIEQNPQEEARRPDVEEDDEEVPRC